MVEGDKVRKQRILVGGVVRSKGQDSAWVLIANGRAIPLARVEGANPAVIAGERHEWIVKWMADGTKRGVVTLVDSPKRINVPGTSKRAMERREALRAASPSTRIPVHAATRVACSRCGKERSGMTMLRGVCAICRGKIMNEDAPRRSTSIRTVSGGAPGLGKRR